MNKKRRLLIFRCLNVVIGCCFYFVFTERVYSSVLLSPVFLLPVLLSSASWSPAPLSESSIHFQNFGEQLTLQPRGDLFLLTNYNLLVKLSPYLIVKSDLTLGQKSLQTAFPFVLKQQLIYEGTVYNYFLVEINDINAIAFAIKELSQFSGIQLVQPDVMQITNSTNLQNSSSRNSKKQSALKSTKENRSREISSKRQGNHHYFAYLKQIGVDALWRKTLGEGVRIAIIDDGFRLEADHFNGMQPAFSYDAENKILDASPKLKIDSHGTKVAKVLFLKHQDQFKGIVPHAKMIALRNTSTWTSRTLLSFQLAFLNRADIINCSWRSPLLMEPIGDVVNDIIRRGRDGKGTAVVFAAGVQDSMVSASVSEAAIGQAIVVGSRNEPGNQKVLSGFGYMVDIYGFGERIFLPPNQGPQDRLAGASLSAAIISGLLALILSVEPELSLIELNEKLRKLGEQSPRDTSDKKAVSIQ